MLAAMVCVFWKLVEPYSVDIWIGRVPSKLNIADAPARNGKIPFATEEQTQFKNLYKLPLDTLVYNA